MPKLGPYRELKRSQLAPDQSFRKMLTAERAAEPGHPALQKLFSQSRSASRRHLPGQLCDYGAPT